MEKKKMMAAMKKDGCSKRSESRKGSCRMSEEQSSCHQPPATEKKSCHDEERSCGKQTESTCICIFCFQFAAPEQIDARLQFDCNRLEQALSSYLLKLWKDPQLAVPWQPPDGLLIS